MFDDEERRTKQTSRCRKRPSYDAEQTEGLLEVEGIA
jgi:hypothetical protein